MNLIKYYYLIMLNMYFDVICQIYQDQKNLVIDQYIDKLNVCNSLQEIIMS